MHRLGIDLGGTKIEGVVLAPAGGAVFRKRIETRQEDGYEAIVARIAALYAGLHDAAGGGAHTLGIGTPGAVSRRTGLLKNSNTLCLNGRPLKADLESRLGRPIRMENDANCFAMAEALHGAGRGCEMVFGVILGTGCGGGIVHKGSVVTGPQCIAGEWGHMSIDPGGLRCYCGRRGCVETYISGGGAEARYAETRGRRLRLAEIAAAAEAGDAAEVEFMREYYEHFGRAMGNLINILDPDIIVLGGGVSNMSGLYTAGIEAVSRHVFSDSFETPIVKHEMGDSAGVVGAALIGV